MNTTIFKGKISNRDARTENLFCIGLYAESKAGVTNFGNFKICGQLPEFSSQPSQA